MEVKSAISFLSKLAVRKSVPKIRIPLAATLFDPFLYSTCVHFGNIFPPTLSQPSFLRVHVTDAANERDKEFAFSPDPFHVSEFRRASSGICCAAFHLRVRPFFVIARFPELLYNHFRLHIYVFRFIALNTR